MSTKVSLFVLLIMLSAAPLVVVAQEQPQPPGEIIIRPVSPEEMRWETFGDAEGEFHARLPESPAVFQTSRRVKDTAARARVRVFEAYEDGVAYLIAVADAPRKGETLDYFTADFKKRFLSSWEMTFDEDVSNNADAGKLYALKKDGVEGAAEFFVKERHAYMVLAAGAGADNPAVERFLNSFTMWRYSIDKMKGPPDAETRNPGLLGPGATPAPKPEKAVDPAQYVLPGIKAIAPDTDETRTTGGAASASGAQNKHAFEDNEVTKPAFVVVQLEPDYTEMATASRIEGVVKLKGVLSATGKVTNISVLEGLPHGLTEKAVDAFRHLSFIPAFKDDQPVSQWFTIEYKFNLD